MRLRVVLPRGPGNCATSLHAPAHVDEPPSRLRRHRLSPTSDPAAFMPSDLVAVSTGGRGERNGRDRPRISVTVIGPISPATHLMTTLIGYMKVVELTCVAAAMDRPRKTTVVMRATRSPCPSV